MVTNTRKRRLWWRHLISFLIAPVTMTLVIPASIVNWRVDAPDLGSPLIAGLVAAGGLLIAGGLSLLIWTVLLFDREGKGTLGVGNVLGEPVNLVVRGPYRHVRNPMITGVLCILLGEAAVLASGWLLLWFAIFSDDSGDRHPVLGRTPPRSALRQRVPRVPGKRSALDSENRGLDAGKRKLAVRQPATAYHDGADL